MMEKYEQITVVGEGSYGIVMKCRHRDTDQLVAVKKFLETEEDATVRRMALREIRMLKRLRHENLVTMIEVFRHRKRFYLVFEYLEGTVLDELEKHTQGLGNERTRERIYQVIRAINYCHANHIIHRDVKPENVLVSSKGIVKLCDFGFARLVGGPGEGYTEYVATRWYRAPELLVGETNYGAQVDIWAIGCLFSEMLSGEPLFPGDSDIDQLFLIVKLLGKPCSRHQYLMTKVPHLRAMRKSSAMESCSGNTIQKTFPSWPLLALDFLNTCMKMDPHQRPTAEELLKHGYFTQDRFPEKFLPALREKVRAEFNENPLLRKYKVDILMASDARKEDVKVKRTSVQHEPPRWKINFVQASVKRKFGSDINCETDSRSVITLNKHIQKLIPQKLGQISKSTLQSLKKDDKVSDHILGSKYNNISYIVPKASHETSKFGSIQKDNPRIDKALDLLSKLNNKNQTHRPKSTNKDHPYNHILTSSPPEFQSLQSHSFRENVKSPSHFTVLHPSITNINFTKEASHSNHSKTNLNQVHKNSSLKKLDSKYSFVESPLLVTERSPKYSPPDWFNVKKKDPWKHKAEEFSLPLVPGASGSPGKSMKKHSTEHAGSKINTPMKSRLSNTELGAKKHRSTPSLHTYTHP